MNKYIIGVDIGGTHLRIGAVDVEHRISHFQKVPTTSVFSANDPLNDLSVFLQSYIQETGICAEAAVIGFPATIDLNRTMVLQAPNVAFMERLPVVEHLQEALHIPVYIERDVCLTVLYDIEKQKIPPCEVLAAFYFGTGIGNVICLNHKPLLGKNGVSGELGHIPVHGNTEVCGCGNQGCMESMAGGKFLAKLCAELYPDTHVADIFTKHGEDPVLFEFVEYMAETVATEVNILDPDYVLIGGGVPSMRDFPRDLLEERIRAHCRKPYPEQNLCLIFTGDDEQKSILGAAIHAERKRK